MELTFIKMEEKETIELYKKNIGQTDQDIIGLSNTIRLLSSKIDDIYDTKIWRDTEPTYEPKNFSEQFYLYKNGTTYRLYVYIDGWHYLTLT